MKPDFHYLPASSAAGRELAGLLDAVSTYGLKEGLLLTEAIEPEINGIQRFLQSAGEQYFAAYLA
jgi:hypothetical protein